MKNMSKTTLQTCCTFLASVLLLLSPGLLSAAHDSITLGTIEVVGKSWMRATTTTLSSNQLKKGKATTLTDILSLVPGMMDSFSGGRNENHFSLRGFGVRYVPVYIDGLQVTAPYDKSTDPGRFVLAGYDRVEVSTGYTSLTLGPNAFAGAINLVSRRPEGEYEARIESGLTANSDWQRASWWTAASASGKKGDFWFKADFFSAERDFMPVSADSPGKDGSKRKNSDSDNRTINLELAWNPASGDEYILRAGIQRGAKNIPTYDGTNAMDNSSLATRFWEMPFWNRNSIALMGKTTLSKTALVRTRIWYDEFDNEIDSYTSVLHTALSSTRTKSVYEDYNFGFSSELVLQPAEALTLQPFVFLRHDSHSSYYIGQLVTEQQRDTTVSGGLENTVQLSESVTLRTGATLSLLVPGMANKANTAGDQLSEYTDEYVINPLPACDWQAGLYWQANVDTLIHATLARRTRFPTLKDRYSSRMGVAWPNPDIKPETSIGTEVGVTRDFGKFVKARAVAFFKHCDDYIQITPKKIDGVTRDQYQNIGRIEIPGLELTMAGAGARVDYTLACTWMNPDNLDSLDRPYDLPRLRIRAEAGFQVVESLRIAANWQYVGTRNTQTVEMGGWNLTGAEITWNPTAWTTISTGVDNLFDVDYASTEGFSLGGREIWLRLSVKY